MLHPGKFQDTAASTMAGAIEAAFKDQWPKFNPDLAVPGEDQLVPTRLLFVAVAQGVVQHLSANPDAFTITVAEAAGHTHAASVSAITADQTTA